MFREPTCAVEGLLAVNLVRGPEKKSTGGVRGGDECFLLGVGQLPDDGLRRVVSGECCDDRVARQAEPAALEVNTGL